MESGDVDRAGDSFETVQAKITALQQACDADIAKLQSSLDATAIALRPVSVVPRKSDIAVGEVALVWTPWRRGNDGFPAEAF